MSFHASMFKWYFFSQVPSKQIANPCILRFSPHNKSFSLLNAYITGNTLSHTSLFHYEFSINHPISITNNLIKPVEFDNPTGLITLLCLHASSQFILNLIRYIIYRHIPLFIYPVLPQSFTSPLH